MADESAPATTELAGTCTGPGPCDVHPLGHGKNWVTKEGGLPAYIRAIAHALQRQGHDKQRAISTAVATVKRWASGGGHVSAGTRSRAASAVAQWEKMKASAHAHAADAEAFTAYSELEQDPGPEFADAEQFGIDVMSDYEGINLADDEVTEFDVDFAEFEIGFAGFDEFARWAEDVSDSGQMHRIPADRPVPIKPVKTVGQHPGTAGTSSSWNESKHPRNHGKFAPLGYGAGYNGGAQNSRVKNVQRMLQHLGRDIGPEGVDGMLGPHTTNAVKQFQQAHGLRVTGVVDHRTLNTMHQAATQHARNQANGGSRATIQRLRQALHRARSHPRVINRPTPAPIGADSASPRAPVVYASQDLVPLSSLLTTFGVMGVDNGPTHAGMVVKAADTGRVLMLQRALEDPEDPAAGSWEFPGGGHEDGDLTSLHTGIREWQEEVGQPFPKNALVAGTWSAPNGIYQGHIVIVPSEQVIAPHEGRIFPNPDDPDGDNSESVAWWDPDDARKNPALREEARDTPWDLIKKAGTEFFQDPNGDTSIVNSDTGVTDPDNDGDEGIGSEGDDDGDELDAIVAAAEGDGQQSVRIRVGNTVVECSEDQFAYAEAEFAKRDQVYHYKHGWISLDHPMAKEAIAERDKRDQKRRDRMERNRAKPAEPVLDMPRALQDMLSRRKPKPVQAAGAVTFDSLMLSADLAEGGDVSLSALEADVANGGPLNLCAFSADVLDRRVDFAVSAEARRRSANKGHALPDGSYPIRHRGELAKAIKAFPRGAGNNGKTKADIKNHILRRARALKAADAIPESWKANAVTASAGEEQDWRALVAAALTEVPKREVPDSVGGGVPFRIPVLLPTGIESGDRREFKDGAVEYRDLPVPLYFQKQTDDGHKASVIVGRIDKVDKTKHGLGEAEGVFDTSPEAQDALRLVRGLFLRGVSGDVDKVDAEMSQADDGKPKVTFSKGRLTAATLVGKPAFAECMIELPGDEEWEQNMANLRNQGGADEPRPLVAAGGPINPPQAWFQDPGLTEPTHLTVTDDGRVFGHIAAWDTPHIGMPFQTAPRSRSGYRYFATGQVKTAEGGLVDVGQLTLVGGHADLSLTADMAVKHYDDTDSAVADVAIGEDAFGIWVAGAQRPGLTDHQVRQFRASDSSGDWRPIGGDLELVAVCQVNCAGFPIPRARVASAGNGQQFVTALVAAGAAPVSHVPDPALVSRLSADALAARVETLEAQRRAEVATELRATVAAARAIEAEQYRAVVAAARKQGDPSRS